MRLLVNSTWNPEFELIRFLIADFKLYIFRVNRLVISIKISCCNFSQLPSRIRPITITTTTIHSNNTTRITTTTTIIIIIIMTRVSTLPIHSKPPHTASTSSSSSSNSTWATIPITSNTNSSSKNTTANTISFRLFYCAKTTSIWPTASTIWTINRSINKWTVWSSGASWTSSLSFLATTSTRLILTNTRACARPVSPTLPTRTIVIYLFTRSGNASSLNRIRAGSPSQSNSTKTITKLSTTLMRRTTSPPAWSKCCSGKNLARGASFSSTAISLSETSCTTPPPTIVH